MIEVEKKIAIREKDLLRIRQIASFVKKTSFTDTYFDTKEYRLTLDNVWLRKREELFELKVGIKKSRDIVDHYEEITKEEEIARSLLLPTTTKLEKALEENGFFPFCSFTTTRETYRFDDLTIDLDAADFGTMTYRLMECELLVSKPQEIPLAEQKIHHFLQEQQISSTPASGKIAIYLAANRKEHYQALVKAGVLRS